MHAFKAAKWVLSASHPSPTLAMVGEWVAGLHLPPLAPRTLARYHLVLPALAEWLLLVIRLKKGHSPESPGLPTAPPTGSQLWRGQNWKARRRAPSASLPGGCARGDLLTDSLGPDPMSLRCSLTALHFL